VESPRQLLGLVGMLAAACNGGGSGGAGEVDGAFTLLTSDNLGGEEDDQRSPSMRTVTCTLSGSPIATARRTSTT
jgi:hypothetical protein